MLKIVCLSSNARLSRTGVLSFFREKIVCTSPARVCCVLEIRHPRFLLGLSLSRARLCVSASCHRVVRGQPARLCGHPEHLPVQQHAGGTAPRDSPRSSAVLTLSQPVGSFLVALSQSVVSLSQSLPGTLSQSTSRDAVLTSRLYFCPALCNVT